MNAEEARRILIVEDEAALVTLLKYNLEKEGYEVRETADGRTALDLVGAFRPHLVLLDWMIPGLSGIEVCRRLRQAATSRDLPVIMLTARSEEADRIRGLEQGADDYVTKPFSITELLARVRAVMRRARPPFEEQSIEIGDITLDLTRHRAFRKGHPVSLGPTEFRLLRYFMEHPGRVFSRDHLLEAVWGHNIHVEPRTVDVHIRRLRKALNGPEDADFIRTVRAAGYAFDSEVPA
ncbi:MAG: phosphate regulon transcriptional regulator PhoB [Alphaproteobacteria bacterium]